MFVLCDCRRLAIIYIKYIIIAVEFSNSCFCPLEDFLFVCGSDVSLLSDSWFGVVRYRYSSMIYVVCLTPSLRFTSDVVLFVRIIFSFHFRLKAGAFLNGKVFQSFNHDKVKEPYFGFGLFKCYFWFVLNPWSIFLWYWSAKIRLSIIVVSYVIRFLRFCTLVEFDFMLCIFEILFFFFCLLLASFYFRFYWPAIVIGALFFEFSTYLMLLAVLLSFVVPSVFVVVFS